MYDIIIKQGKVIDFTETVSENQNIFISEGIFVNDPQDINAKAKREINADGCIVAPGFVDSHLHVFDGGGSYDLNASPDLACIPNCVTTCIDGGSAGPLTFEGFFRSNIAYSKTTIKALIHMCFNGIMPNGYDEDVNPDSFDIKNLRRLIKKYGGESIVGLKIRQHNASAGKYGVRPLKATVAFAEEIEKEFGIKLRVTVHVTDIAPDIEMKDIVELLRPGDVFTHVYSGLGKTILDKNGKVLKEILDARDRGVLFDSGFATSRLDLKVVEAAFEEEFFPDLIGTDTVGFNFYLKPMFSLPYQMSLLMAMGMPLESILKAVTFTPALNYGFLQEAGTLAAGRKADVSIVKIIDFEETFTDLKGRSVVGNKMIVPMATIKEGQVGDCK